MSFGDTSRGDNQWALGDEQAEPVFRQAVELGITFWDTANAYGYGTSEEIVGRVLPHDDKPIADAAQAVAADRGVSMARVALAWVPENPVVSAPIVGATKPHPLADAAAALDLRLTDEEVQRLEGAYTPRTPTGFQ